MIKNQNLAEINQKANEIFELNYFHADTCLKLLEINKINLALHHLASMVQLTLEYMDLTDAPIPDKLLELLTLAAGWQKLPTLDEKPVMETFEVKNYGKLIEDIFNDDFNAQMAAEQDK